jgi:flavin reductase (DIM6/NTAB) family NADH-FMN oxidoreductase RutF
MRIEKSRKFCLNLLSENDLTIAKEFSEKSSSLENYDIMLSNGACEYAHLKNSIATICCNLEDIKSSHENKIIFADVMNFAIGKLTNYSRILAYHKREYLKL